LNQSKGGNLGSPSSRSLSRTGGNASPENHRPKGNRGKEMKKTRSKVLRQLVTKEKNNWPCLMRKKGHGGRYPPKTTKNSLETESLAERSGFFLVEGPGKGRLLVAPSSLRREGEDYLAGAFRFLGKNRYYEMQPLSWKGYLVGGIISQGNRLGTLMFAHKDLESDP